MILLGQRACDHIVRMLHCAESLHTLEWRAEKRCEVAVASGGDRNHGHTVHGTKICSGKTSSAQQTRCVGSRENRDLSHTKAKKKAPALWTQY